MKLLTALLLAGLTVSAQQSAKTRHVIDPKAIQLNDSAIDYIKYGNPDSAQKALSFLNRATEIDTNYYLAYYHKLGVQTFLKQYAGAVITVRQLIRLRPHYPDLLLNAGYLYEVTGDTGSAREYYQKASVLYGHYLDTMKTANPGYFTMTMNAGINLVLMGQDDRGNQVLKKLYDRQKDILYQETIAPYMNKTREEILARLTDMPK
jgi:tetratricopeptide (TPR) repeat protein